MRRLIAVLILVPGVLRAQWFENGKPIPDEPWRKSRGDFGVMLLLSDDPQRFLDEWDKPGQPTMRTTNTAERGKPIVAFVLFVGCREKKGRCNSEVDFTVLKPDGSVYASQKGMELWNDKPAIPKHKMQLSVANLGIRIEPNDALGRYIVRAQARDLNADTEIEVEQPFTAMALLEAPGEEKPVGGWTPDTFASFTTYYFQKPQPALIASAMRYMQEAGYPRGDEQVAPLVGFFSEVFAANQTMASAWKAEAARTTGSTNRVLTAAFQDSQNLEVLTTFDPEHPNPSLNDLCWGAYFASGKQLYVTALIQRLAYLSERKSLMLYLTAASAQWSLSSNAQQHPSVKRLLEAARATAPPNMNAAIDEALTKEPGELREGMLRVLREGHEARVW